jgi:hypothetical protein
VVTNAISTASFKKPIHNVKDEPLAICQRSGYRRRNMCDGKLVAYILEDMICAEAQSVFAPKRVESGGAYRDRTDDLMLAKQPLSQLS